MKHAPIALLQLLLFATVGLAQEHAPQDVVAGLLPDHNARRIVDPSPAEKGKAVKRLQVAQKQATRERSQEVAFLLAAYGSDYEKNRDYLIHTLRGCTSPSIKFGCNDNTGAFLIVLYKRGHKELLEPLMLLGKDSYNTALAEVSEHFTVRFSSRTRPSS